MASKTLVALIQSWQEIFFVWFAGTAIMRNLVQTILLLRIKKEEKAIAMLQIDSLIPFLLVFFTVLRLENGIALFVGYYRKAKNM
jgi:hypothetical protein